MKRLRSDIEKRTKEIDNKTTELETVKEQLIQAQENFAQALQRRNEARVCAKLSFLVLNLIFFLRFCVFGFNLGF